MTKKISFIFLLLLFAFNIILPVQAASLKDATKVTTNIAKDAGYETNEDANINTMTGTVINAFLVLLGTIFLALMVYGGYLWMTGMGNTERVEKSKSLISAAIIGLIITLASYAISYFVLDTFTEPTLSDEMRE